VTDFTRANAQVGMFKKARCEAARFDGADLTYADFSNADVSAAVFTGATMFRTILHRVKEQGTVWGNRLVALGDDPDLAAAERWQPST